MVLILSLLPLAFRVLQILAPTLPVYMASSFVLAACYMALYIAAFSLGKLPRGIISFQQLNIWLFIIILGTSFWEPSIS